MVKLVRFTPTANVTSARPNDVIRFNLQGNGFLDPYSTYIKFSVNLFPDNDAKAVASEDGITEITPANMNTDIGTSLTKSATQVGPSLVTTNSVGVYRGKYLDRSAHSFINRLIIRSQGTELERVEQYDVMAAIVNDMLYSHEQKKAHHQEGFPTKMTSVDSIGGGVEQSRILFPMDYQTSDQLGKDSCDVGWTQYTLKADGKIFQPTQYVQNSVGSMYKLTSPVSLVGESAWQSNLYTSSESIGGGAMTTKNLQSNSNVLTFCIPIYSGLIGVLMPDKKLIPLSLMPLELEFGLNPYALYTIGEHADAAVSQKLLTRNYTINNFEIYGHMLFFEQEVHRSLEAVVAQQGVFIHFNSFYLAPVTVNQGNAQSQITKFSQINIHFKSINAVHFVFIYAGFENNANQRKLNFVSHGLTDLQIRNGTDLIPSEPIRGDMRKGNIGEHSQFFTETLKGWNKMHDPETDTALTCLNYCLEDLDQQALYYPSTDQGVRAKQSILGRAQFAVSLEGEELGKDKSTVTGRRGMTPFDIMQTGIKSNSANSYQIIFVRADFVVFVRPDLVVTLLGR